MRKIIFIIPIISLITIIIFVVPLYQVVPGKNIVEQVPEIVNISVAVRKDVVIDSQVNIPGVFRKLAEDDVEQLFNAICESRFRDIGIDAFPIKTNSRYLIQIKNQNGVIITQMEFYGTDVLIVDYIYGSKPVVHKRYKILSTNLGSLFLKW